MLFIIIHQTYELWFKQLLHEVDTIVEMMKKQHVLAATRLLGRCIEIQKVLVQQVNVLETMTPMDFLAFRDRLQPASGFQSAQFRELEFALGMREERFLNYHRDNPEAQSRLQHRLTSETVPDVFFALLRSRGLDVPATPEDPDELESVRERRVAALAKMYGEFENHYDLFLLAEALLDMDQQLLLWRQRHVVMVLRVIGGRMGTGGSAGAAYLQSTLEKKAFPELWDARTAMSSSHEY
jgi:tryptophan 2,3-dioxygenase